MELASLIVAILALLVSFAAFIKSNSSSNLANELAKKQVELTGGQVELTKGQVEMQIREMISTAKSRYADLAVQLSKEPENTTLLASVSAALEDVLNAYDEACSKYIDDYKVDKERFKKLYVTEIRNIVEDEDTKQKYVMPQSKFKATVRVYTEWNNLES